MLQVMQLVLIVGQGQVMLLVLTGKGSGGGVSFLVCSNSGFLLLLRQQPGVRKRRR